MYIFRGKYLDLRHFKSVELKPNLFIIGAEKSGTTSLHHYLDQHPEIFMAKPNKEAHFLLNFKKSKVHYRQAGMPIKNRRDILKNHVLRGYQTEKIIGESSTSYSRGHNPEEYGVIKRLSDYQPSAKLIYIIRHPLERIVSSYLQRVREKGLVSTLDFEINKRAEFLLTSLYGYQLQKYLKVIPARQIHIVMYDNLVHNGSETLKRITRFLGVDEDFLFDVSKVHNSGKDKSKYPENQRKFSTITYRKIFKRIHKDISQLKRLTGTEIDWVFKEEDWGLE